MANRSMYSLFKGLSRETFLDGLRKVSRDHPQAPPQRESRWSDWRYSLKEKEHRICWRGSTATVTPAFAGGIALSKAYSCAYLELRVQESDHWDFALFDSGEFVADFATHGDYWGDPVGARMLPWRRGDLETFSRVWNVDGSTLARYFVDWAALPKASIGVEKAYETDRSPYGDANQCYDFLNRIGGANSWWEDDHESFQFPAWESIYLRQSPLRRLIRDLSVRFRGAYPDMPAKSREERRAMALSRKPTIRILKHHPEVFVQRFDQE